MFKTKIVSSLEKAFLDEKIDKFERLEKISALRGEKVSIQLLYTYELDEEKIELAFCEPKLSGPLAKYATLRNVVSVPVVKPVRGAYDEEFDGGYLRTTPGLYPDLLTPLTNLGRFRIMRGALDSLWIDIEIPEDFPAGECSLTVTTEAEPEYLKLGKRIIGEDTVTIDVIGATLPEQTLRFTQWFHCDSLANYYRVPVWSEEHWRIVEEFAKAAKRNGLNTLFTPIFTPPIDTYVGGERLTNQLITIKKTGNRYSYSWKLLDRWIDMVDRVGIKYFEISHLATQGGAAHAPKIMATVDGEYKRIFGWETDSTSEEYLTFLRSVMKALVNHLKKRGVDHRCVFHIADEPHTEHLPTYKKVKRAVSGILKDYIVMDALSDFDFWKRGVVKSPIPCCDHIQPFIDAGVPGLWTYYCCGQNYKVSNRYHSMPSARNRSIGMQMYKYQLVGFAHWGFNYYQNESSYNPTNPFLDSCGEKWIPAGDAFTVYPAPDGTAYDSIRGAVFYDALQDMRAMQLAEELYSHEEVVAAIEEVLGFELRFDTCVYTSSEMLAVRERINEMIKAAKA